MLGPCCHVAGKVCRVIGEARQRAVCIAWVPAGTYPLTAAGRRRRRRCFSFCFVHSPHSRGRARLSLPHAHTTSRHSLCSLVFSRLARTSTDHAHVSSLSQHTPRATWRVRVRAAPRTSHRSEEKIHRPSHPMRQWCSSSALLHASPYPRAHPARVPEHATPSADRPESANVGSFCAPQETR